VMPSEDPAATRARGRSFFNVRIPSITHSPEGW
jgi:hypothetical protein